MFYKSKLVGTNVFHKLFVPTHTFVAKKDVFCHDKHVFVATTPLLQLLSGKTFVATNMILMAAPASDSFLCFCFHP